MDKERIINILKLTIVGLQQTAELPSNLILSSGICSHISRLYLNEQITIAERLLRINIGLVIHFGGLQ
jgi:hypothetical protein